MKKMIASLVGCVLLFLFGTNAYGMQIGEVEISTDTSFGMENQRENMPNEQSEETVDEMVQEQLDTYNLTDISDFWNEILYQYGGYLPETKQGDLKSFISEIQDGDYSAYFQGFLKYFFHEIFVQADLLGMLVLLTILSTFLQMIQTTFEKSSVSKIAYFMIFMVLFVIALNSSNDEKLYHRTFTVDCRVYGDFGKCSIRFVFSPDYYFSHQYI